MLWNPLRLLRYGLCHCWAVSAARGSGHPPRQRSQPCRSRALQRTLLERNPVLPEKCARAPWGRSTARGIAANAKIYLKGQAPESRNPAKKHFFWQPNTNFFDNWSLVDFNSAMESPWTLVCIKTRVFPVKHILKFQKFTIYNNLRWKNVAKCPNSLIKLSAWCCL